MPLVMFNYPCLFRQLSLSSLDLAGRRWREVLTSPSLQAIWAALRSNFGVGVRIEHNVPSDIVSVDHWPEMPALPSVELRLLGSKAASKATRDMMDILCSTTEKMIRLKDPGK